MTAKWIETATKKGHCANLSNAHLYTVHGNIGADGFRLHRDLSLPAEDSDAVRYLTSVIPTQPRNRATVSKSDLMRAVQIVLAFREGSWVPTMTFCMNGSLQYSAKNESIGKTHGEIIDGAPVFTRKGKKINYDTRMTFKHDGPTVSFALNPKYLRDALAGMDGDTVEIDIPSPTAPFYMTDGTHEAVIMPLSIGLH